MNIEETINKNLAEAKRLFNNLKHFEPIIIKDIDCSELPDPDKTKGNDLPEELLNNVFYKLHEFDKEEGKVNDDPALYVFELCDENQKEAIIEKFKMAQETITDRRLPSLKKSKIDSKFLYVGKVESGVGGRIVTHLGYYHQRENHGLQLAHWAREKKDSFKLNLYVYRFEKEFKPFIEAMEVMLAKELNPLIGKH